nr:unnamed protein product [Callosobruchus analis]
MEWYMECNNGEEDCLYLNVYVPDTKPPKNLDVVIHIHGGAYMVGFPHEYVDEKYVMDRDLILVTFNYRIGALGFLSTEDEVVPGNNGLKDQTLALQWVQNNIESFNGNPQSVTLTGFSAGASSVHLHYLSTYSRDLFHRGMSISGTALNPWALRLNPQKIAKRLAKSVGCETGDTKKMVKCLKTRPAHQIVEQADDLHGFGPLPYCLFQPVVDKHAKRPFLEDLPENLLKSGKVLDIPWIASFTYEEGLLVSLAVKHHIEKVNREWDEIGPYILHTDDASTSFQQEALRKIKQYYAASGENLTIDELTKLSTDSLMRYGIERSIELQSAAVTSPVYYYRFGYTGQNSLKHLLTSEDIKGACHGEDMVYFFGGLMMRPPSVNDVKMKNICLDVLYTYAHDGKPKAANIDWEPTSRDLKYYEINKPELVKMEHNTDDADHVSSTTIVDEQGRPVTHTPLGPVEGEWRTSFDGRTYAAFEGIPYAKPPVGDLRFAEPQPIEPWIGTWNATRIYKCPQVGNDGAIGEEDCLYLNVYVPKTQQSKLLDVVIHIHGGAFSAGYSNEYIGDKYVMDRDLVLVAFNYRLGALGFLSTEDTEVPGNNGLRDETLALKWVQDNIESFSGNPRSVTLTGFSAGSASVHLHYLSSYSKDLFQRGMSISGCALNPWAIRLNPLENAKRLAESLGCPSNNTKKMVRCLKLRPASQIVEQTATLYSFSHLPFCLFAPVVDKHARRPFLSDLPENLLKSGKVLDLPWMVSFTFDDGQIAAVIAKPLIEQLNRRWFEDGPYFLNTDDIPTYLQKEALRKIRARYATSNGSFTFDDLTKLATDGLVIVGIEESIELQNAAVQSPIYYNRFGYSGQNSFKRLHTNEDIEGIYHGDDMIYYFGGRVIKPLSENDIKMKNVCLDILYTYAKNG